MKKTLALLALLLACAVTVYAQIRVVSNNTYTIMYDAEGRCIFGIGTAPAVSCQDGALFFRTDLPNLHYYSAGGWRQIVFEDLQATTFASTGDADFGGALAGASILSDAGITATTRFIATPVAQTIADSGDGSAAAGTVAGTSEVVQITCSDTDGCALTLSETGATTGAKLFIINVGTNALTIADSAGVQETTGALSLGANDNVWFCYIPSAWVQCMAVTNVA